MSSDKTISSNNRDSQHNNINNNNNHYFKLSAAAVVVFLSLTRQTIAILLFWHLISFVYFFRHCADDLILILGIFSVFGSATRKSMVATLKPEKTTQKNTLKFTLNSALTFSARDPKTENQRIFGPDKEARSLLPITVPISKAVTVFCTLTHYTQTQHNKKIFK